MKTYKHLYERIMAFENLYLAFRKARRGKRHQPDVATFEMYLEDNLHRPPAHGLAAGARNER